MQVGLADDHAAGVDDALDGGGRAHRHVVAEERRAVGRAHAGRVEQVLGRERHARERPEPALLRERAGVAQAALAIRRDERVELGPGLDAVEVVGDDLLGGDVAGAHAARDLVTGPVMHRRPFLPDHLAVDPDQHAAGDDDHGRGDQPGADRLAPAEEGRGEDHAPQ